MGAIFENITAAVGFTSLAAKERILESISSGAAMWAAIRVSQQAENEGKTIVVILPDTGQRYIYTEMFE